MHNCALEARYRQIAGHVETSKPRLIAKHLVSLLSNRSFLDCFGCILGRNGIAATVSQILAESTFVEVSDRTIRIVFWDTILSNYHNLLNSTYFTKRCTSFET